MALDHELCYRALRARDPRFDGRFFTAVRTTGVYCRPVCPARTPKPENCVFVPCAAAAQEAGFRPCLRCRPEASPGTPAWLGTSATVSRALRLVGEGALDGGRVEDLAARLGVGERHLRRLFLRHLGASPIAVAQTRRLQFAKQLLDETTLSMTEVALSSGFSSLRRFNAAMLEAYGRPPRALRGAQRVGASAARGAAGAAEASAPRGISLRLPFRPPYPWEAMAGFLATRAIPGVEAGGVDVYRRAVRVGGAHGIVEVRLAAPRPTREGAPGADHLVATMWLPAAAGLIDVAERLRRLFDVGADPEAIAAALGADPRLRKRLDALPGVRVPGAWDGFELAVRAILGQQVSVAAARTLAGRLAAAYGEPLSAPWAAAGAEAAGLRYVFPTPQAVAEADLGAIGVTRARAAAIRSLAAAVARGEVALDASRGLEETTAALVRLPGIGAWTAHYIAMRALREPDAMPASDLGLRRALGGVSAAELSRAAEAWRPFRAYAAALLWMTDMA